MAGLMAGFRLCWGCLAIRPKGKHCCGSLFYFQHVWKASFAQRTWKLPSLAKGGPWKGSLCTVSRREWPEGNFHQVWGPLLDLASQIESCEDRKFNLSTSVPPPPPPLLPKSNPKHSPCGGCVANIPLWPQVCGNRLAPPQILTNSKTLGHQVGHLRRGISAKECGSWKGS